jgi:hypothetical protein
MYTWLISITKNQSDVLERDIFAERCKEYTIIVVILDYLEQRKNILERWQFLERIFQKPVRYTVYFFGSIYWIYYSRASMLI